MRLILRHALAVGVAVLSALGAGVATAHHGWSGYDSSKEMTLTGTISEAGYEHPHGYIRLEAAGKTWVVVLAPPTRMENRGLPSATMLAPARRPPSSAIRTAPSLTRCAPSASRSPERPPNSADAPAERPGLGVWLRRPLAVAMRQWLWLYPIVEIPHIVGFVLARRRRLHLRRAPARALPCASRQRRWPRTCCAGRGWPCSWSRHRLHDVHGPRHRDRAQPRLRLKLLLIAAALLNAAASIGGRSGRWRAGTPSSAPWPARLAAVVSLVALGRRDRLRAPASIFLSSEGAPTPFRRASPPTDRVAPAKPALGPAAIAPLPRSYAACAARSGDVGTLGHRDLRCIMVGV